MSSSEEAYEGIIQQPQSQQWSGNPQRRRDLVGSYDDEDNEDNEDDEDNEDNEDHEGDQDDQDDQDEEEDGHATSTTIGTSAELTETGAPLPDPVPSPGSCLSASAPAPKRVKRRHPIVRTTQHPDHWQLDGNVIVQIKATRFKLQRSRLAKASIWFQNTFERRNRVRANSTRRTTKAEAEASVVLLDKRGVTERFRDAVDRDG